VDFDKLCEPNQAMWDRVLRLVVAAILIVAFMQWWIAYPWNYALLALAVIAIFTAVCGHCFIYDLFGFSTAKKKAAAAK